MAVRKYYYLVHNDSEGWRVIHNKAVIYTNSLKEEALRWARATAKANVPSQLQIQDRYGNWLTDATYEDDPFPPRG